MARNVTLTFDDGSTHVYNGVPDDATPEMVTQRASQEFQGKNITNIDGGRNGTTSDGRANGTGGADGVQQAAWMGDGQNSGLAGVPSTGVQDEGASFPGASFIEPTAAVISGAIAEPIAGLAGIVMASDPVAEQGAGAKAVESTREALTYKPRTEAGKQGLQSVGEALAPIGEAMKGAESYLGDEVFKATDSPALAAAATTIPTVMIEALGYGLAKGGMKSASSIKNAGKARAVKRATVSAAPEVERIKEVSRSVYKEIDDAGVTLPKATSNSLKSRIESMVAKEGIDPDITPKSFAAMRRLSTDLESARKLGDIDNLRKVAQNAAGDVLNKADSRIGAMIVDEIDTFLDSVGSKALRGNGAKAATRKFKAARELWGRARRSELLNEAMTKAGDQATGLENGLRVQFRAILNNKKKARFFKPDEINAMKQVVQGTRSANVAKLIGRFGFSEGQAMNQLGAVVGAGAGGAMFGGPGAMAVPLIGQVSKKLAQRLTRGNAEFADAVVRAGKDADKIAAAYLSRTPKAARSSAELSELFLKPDVALEAALVSRNRMIREAAEQATGMRVLGALSGTAAVGAPGAIKEINMEK